MDGAMYTITHAAMQVTHPVFKNRNQYATVRLIKFGITKHNNILSLVQLSSFLRFVWFKLERILVLNWYHKFLRSFLSRIIWWWAQGCWHFVFMPVISCAVFQNWKLMLNNYFSNQPSALHVFVENYRTQKSIQIVNLPYVLCLHIVWFSESILFWSMIRPCCIIDINEEVLTDWVKVVPWLFRHGFNSVTQSVVLISGHSRLCLCRFIHLSHHLFVWMKELN